MHLLFLALVCVFSIVLADGDYNKHVSTLQGILSQIQTTEKNIRDLIVEKNKIQDKAKLKEIIETIKVKLKERKELIVRYGKEYHHIRYEHPEKGKTFQTKYKKMDAKYEKEFEDEINSQLSGILRDVKKKYPTEAEDGN
jgi:cell division protein FtsL